MDKIKKIREAEKQLKLRRESLKKTQYDPNSSFRKTSTQQPKVDDSQQQQQQQQLRYDEVYTYSLNEPSIVNSALGRRSTDPVAVPVYNTRPSRTSTYHMQAPPAFSHAGGQRVFLSTLDTTPGDSMQTTRSLTRFSRTGNSIVGG
jgi:hypothetical protein